MTLLAGDLTTITTAQGYLVNAPNATVLSGMITRISRWIQAYCERSLFVPRNYTQAFNGTGTTSLVLPEWPLIDISFLSISGVQINLAPQPGPVQPTFTNPYGYRFELWSGVPPGVPAVVELVGGAWYYSGNQNIVANYKAGYQITGEIPNATSYTPLAPYGIWATDQGVVYTAGASTGMSLVPVAGPTPGPGQYVIPQPDLAVSPTYVYTFNAADISTGLAISYGFVPSDVEEAALELLTMQVAWRQRPGIRSQVLASQETLVYDLSGMPQSVKMMLQNYKSVVPPAIGASV